MDGLSRAAGVGPTIQLGGETLQVCGHVLEHHALISAEIAKQKCNPFELIRQCKESLGEDDGLIQQIVTRIIYESREWQDATLTEMGQWLSATWSGKCFSIWLAIRDNDRKKWTLEKVTQEFSRQYEKIMKEEGVEAAQEWEDKITGSIDKANGDDELGNSTGSSPGAEGEQEKSTTETKNESPGTTSTTPC